MNELFGIREEFTINNDSITVRLVHPVTNRVIVDSSGRYAEITLASLNNQVAKDYLKKLSQKPRKVMREGDEDVAKSNAEFYEALTLDVNNIEYKGLVMTKDIIYRMYIDPDLYWVLDQLGNALNM